MTHEEILAWARENKVNYYQTQQGLELNDMFDVTLVSGAMTEPSKTITDVFEEPQRTHEQSETTTAYGYDDDQAIVVVVEDDESPENNWLHILLYDTVELYDKGWETQGPANKE